MSDTHLAFQGAIITPDPATPGKLLFHPTATLIVTNTLISHFTPILLSTSSLPVAPTVIPSGHFLLPGFIDTHNHAPQWPMRGLGQGLHILDWLAQVTFPFEARYAEAGYARARYEETVEDFLRQGITMASYYGSRHMEATKILAEVCLEKGQRALVGKCNMDREAPEYLVEESAEVSLRETEECIKHIHSLGDSLVRPILTPRFAICCTPELLQGLSTIMKKNPEIPMQTHFNEAEQEVSYTTHLFPHFKGSEADLYDHYNLLDHRSILAHCTIMTPYETQRLAELKCSVSHCPISNMTVGGGFMVAPIRRFLNQGIKVGLGTDSGGGWSNSMLMVIRQALIASNAQEVASKGEEKGLSIEEGVWLATAGGAAVLSVADRVGGFRVGMEFDAIWVKTTEGLQTGMAPREKGDGLRGVFEKFVMTGDDRNMEHVFVRGKRVAGVGKWKN